MNAENGSFDLADWTYGSLSSNPEHPLSDVSVANSSLSIDMLKGCALQCAYCHVQGAQRNLDETGSMPRKATHISRHTPESVLQALRLHPVYTPDAVISIGTSSTEPFVKGAVGNAIDIMQTCLDLHMPNPIWIVTKAGVPGEAISYIRRNSPKQTIIISPTWGGANGTIEPAQNDRFSGAKEAHQAGAKILLYMRPIVPEWGSDAAKITGILEQAKDKIGESVTAIAPGGLRWTQGVEYGLSKRGLSWPESVPKIDNKKELSDEHWDHIFQECDRLFPGVPVVRNSSCGLSHILGTPDIGAKHYLDPTVCASSACSVVQRVSCQRQREILQDSALSHPTLKRQVYATTGHDGLPPTDKPSEVTRWLFRLPYNEKTTAIKTLGRYVP